MRPSLDLETELNPQQLEAVTHGTGPQLVLAGAGSGKTRVITYRVAWLVREVGVPADAVVAVTFTNKAAGEMHERIERLLGITPLPTFVGTFHRFALGLLRRWGPRIGVPSGFVIFDRDDQISAVKKALQEEGIAESSFQPRQVLAAISAAKNRLMGPSEYEAAAGGFYERKVAPVYRRYQTLLRNSSAVDFDDMLRLSGAAARRRGGGARAAAQPHRLPAGRRVPGHQPRPDAAGPPGDRRRRQPDRGGRRGSGHLPLARRRPRQRARLRAQLPRRHGAQARAQLPLDAGHPRHRLGARRAQPAPAAQEAVDRSHRRRAARALPRPRRGRRGPLAGLRARRTCRTRRCRRPPSWCAPTPRPAPSKRR